MSKRKYLILLISLLIPISLFTACSLARSETTTTPPLVVTSTTISATPEASATPVTPTPTPVPLAAVVNGVAITMAEFQAELTRYQASATITGTILASDPDTMVMDELIDQTLLAQAAIENGFIVDESMLKSRISSLEAQLGGFQALIDWESAHGYSGDDFQNALQRSVGAAWMRDQIINLVPQATEQVHVKQILVPTAGEAEELYNSLQSGSNFLELAETYDPLTGGDLGWFPRGFLAVPTIDEAVFALQPGQYSQVVETEIGYHIFYVLERDENHTLQSEARIALQVGALKAWISERRNQSEINILLP